MRLIPGRTKIKVELFKGVTITDLIIAAVFIALIVFVVLSTLPGKLWIIGALVLVAAALLARIDSDPNYRFLMNILRHYGLRRSYRRKALDAGQAAYGKKKAEKKSAGDMGDIMAYTDVKDDLIHYGGKYYGAVIQIEPVEFRFLSPSRRTNSIDRCMANILRALPMQFAANIVKIERPVMYDSVIEKEYNKLEEIRNAYEKGMFNEDELKARVEILYDRINDLRDLCYDNKVIQPCYYLVLFDSDRQQLNNAIDSAQDSLASGEMVNHRLDTKELAVFLKYTNQLDFDEREIEDIAPENYAAWAMPSAVSMRPRTTTINGIMTHNLRVVNYPSVVDDAWMASVMSLPATKVVVKCTPMDRSKAIRGIDRSLSELRGQYMRTGVDSKMIELQSHIQTLGELLATLQGDNESLLEVNIYVTAYDINYTRKMTPASLQPPPSDLANITNFKRLVRRTYQEQGIRVNNMDFNQVEAFIGSQISAWDPMKGSGRGIPAASVAAMYPWIFAHVMDDGGVKMGSESGVPVFVDFFRRDSERVNSNMVIIGKSGSGKSYATKALLANLAADDSKIFILDPENEYTELADNLHGKTINVGNPLFGRLNPFHIITALDDDENAGETVSGSYATHLQFLEEFFRQIMPDCERDAMEYLNSIVDRMYTNMGITAETNLRTLRPEDYPVFDDLYDAVLAEFQATDNEYIRTMLRTLMNYVSKFSTGGRNSNLWNGPSTVTTEENFTVFNFQSLLANRNSTIANAQMLLVLKYVDNEIIKNREYNRRYGTNRKIVVVIDEAHVFIDTKFPVALDFMFQLAKRIRKYNGMQIVITQNVKDFVGSEEIARKSTAIINACQYSFIFSLAPNDMDDLCKLYEKAGGINEAEQEQIISAPRGQAFAVMSPTSHSTFKVEVPGDIATMFQDTNFTSSYFVGEEGDRNWEDFVAESREKRKMLTSVANMVEAVQADEGKKKKKVLFEEISEEELLKEQETAKPKAKKPILVEEVEEPAKPTPAPAAIPVQTIVQPAPQVVVQAPDHSAETEKMLGELLQTFSYETMVREIRRSVREEIEQQNLTTHTAAPAPAPAYDTEDDEDDTSSGVSLGSIFDGLDDDYSSDTGDTGSDGEEEDDGFDIMALLAEEAEHISSISPIEMMETYDEQVIEISLEELAQYNLKQHQGGNNS